MSAPSQVDFFSKIQRNLSDLAVILLKLMAGSTREIDEARQIKDDATTENKQKAAEYLEKLERDHRELDEQCTALWNFLAEVSVFLLRNNGPEDYFKGNLNSLIQDEETKHSLSNKWSQLYYDAKTLNEMYDQKIQQLYIDLGMRRRKDLGHKELLAQLKKMEELPNFGQQIAAFTALHKASRIISDEKYT